LSDLWTAYLGGDERVAPFFAHRCGDWASVVEARRRNAPGPLDRAAGEELADANAQWGVAPRVVERAAMLSSPQTRVIATGQQAGLLGGPLYTLYKAIAGVRWAERLERELAVPVVPIFWVASEDDDFDEVRFFGWQDAAGDWREYAYEAAGHRAGMPVHDIAVEPPLRHDLAAAFAHTRQTEFTPVLGERMKTIAAESNDLEALFIRTLAWLLGERAPLFISPRMKWVRQGAAAVIERELAQPGESSRLILEAGERLAACGFSPSLHRRPEHVNCFVLRDGLRHRVLVRHGAFELVAPKGERQKVAADQLRAELSSDPARFSLNVVTRPIVQDRLLPTLATVGGPGEVGYFAQLRGVYELFGVAMPMILPRPQVCLIEPRVERALAKLDIAIESAVEAVQEFPEQFDSLVQRATRQPAVENRLEAARRRMEEALEFLGAQTDLADPAVARSFERLQDAIKTGFEKLAERQRKAARARDAETTRAVTTARDSLWPGGLPQERALTIFFPFLNLFGTPLIKHLAEAIPLEARGIQPIVLAALMAGEGKP